ncbi:hypothetical protein 2 [Beihai paphia shell virus 2]|uniref:hypothetical protein 2 n=1 Tax=Beihai paphia shell virus 2 TaxID=1922497 RepID=UPI00090A444A|nr:hypothetical protein 2 [Beihai paphia shell virus 2]APG78607.1 hypothetical protein 2 [Beihai paphia shell virus 2]APG78964.1 hypothetical protein 2 [Beihai paphia shell virus 2]
MYTVDSMPDSTFGQADLSDARLEDFFKRPIKIASFEWATNNLIFEKFNPWTLYFENTRILNRISNFSLLRAKLHLKILINGNGFHYGRAIVSYLPLKTFDDFTVDRGFFQQDIVQASQRPHIYLDPTTSQGGDMVLPFFYFKNALSIPEVEWREMGEIILQSINNLKHANGATDRVTISVFAWAEDVTLSMPTASNPLSLSPQCGEDLLDPQADEYGTGPISKPASLISRWAGSLRSAPVLAPYARATEIAASAVAATAKIFGYSRPAVLSDIMPYKPTFVGNLANTNMPDSVQRLTLDSKQEVTIDPRTVGLGAADELAITPLACRESYVSSFPWTIAANSEQLLWNSEVTPMMWSENPITTPSEIHMTPSCWVSLPFKHWRGSMEFRFQIVASQYHKGRLKIVWDPYYPATNEYVTNYTWILDLAEEKDCTVKIGWGNQLGYCFSDTPGVASPPHSTTAIVSPPQGSANGILSVYVVNELTVPNSITDNDIEINVFTKMCDDFEVANPTSEKLERYSYFVPPQTESARNALVEAAGYPFGVAALCKRVGEAKEKEQKEQRLLRKTDKLLAPEVRQMFIDKYLDKEARAQQLEPLDVQAGEETMPKGDQEDTSEPSKPMTTQVDNMLANVQLDPTDHALDVYFGEQVVSLRQVMKRYNLHTTFGTFTSGLRFYKRTANNLPYHRGYAPGGVHSVDLVPYNRAKMTLMNWIMPAYTAWRGATRWKYVRSRETTSEDLAGAPGFIQNCSMTVRRLAGNAAGYSESTPVWVSIDEPNYIAYDNLRHIGHTWDGNTATMTTVNPVIEAELPYYSNFRFGFAKAANLTTAVNNATFFHELETMTAVNEVNGCQFDSYCSIGEDFSLYFFTGAPIVYNVGVDDPIP